uniref:Uncharacterized protein n=1 Tax=Anser cygnoides TaxID=8845 RepID=A0A8B9IM09_ANSCY
VSAALGGWLYFWPREQLPCCDGSREHTGGGRVCSGALRPSPWGPGSSCTPGCSWYEGAPSEGQLGRCETPATENSFLLAPERSPGRSVSASPPESPPAEEQTGGAGLKRNWEERDPAGHYDSDGDKSDYNLVVDEDPRSEPSSPSRAPSSQLPPARDVPESPASGSSGASSRSVTPPRLQDRELPDPPASTSSVSPPPRDTLTPGPGPSSAALLRQPPAKAPATDTTALRSPLSISSPFTASFGLVPHAALNSELAAPSMYVGIHLPPQVSSAVMYGRSPMVAFESHPHLRASALPASLSTVPAGKPCLLTNKELADYSWLQPLLARPLQRLLLLRRHRRADAARAVPP